MHLVKESQGSLSVSHNGVEKCRERLLQSLKTWKKILYKFILIHVLNAPHEKPGNSYNYLQPKPQCSAPNQRVPVDLFGPLLSTD
jgi:hypothetical protein